MAPPLSNSQIERLGVRLIERDLPAPDDIALLHRVLEGYGPILDEAVNRVRDSLGVAPSSRIKNTGTILEKLRREGGSRLKGMQDVAGMRLIESTSRAEQDALVRDVVALFSDEPRTPRVIDRRESPSHGYRAVHVIVYPGGLAVEIQIRTRSQHEWAEVFEKLADKVGRGIRYGEPPAHWMSQEERDAADPMIARLYGSAYSVREVTVELALALAEFIASVEMAEEAMPDEPALAQFRERVATTLESLRAEIDDFA